MQQQNAGASMKMRIPITLLILSMTLEAKCANIQMKIGIIHEASTNDVADIVQGTILSVSNHSFMIDAVKILQNNNLNLTEFVFREKITAILSVARQLDCQWISNVKKLTPFYIVARSIDSCDHDQIHDSIMHLFPPNFALMSALASTAKLYGWMNAIVLEKTNDEVQFGFSDMQYTSEQGIETIAFEAHSDEASLKQSLKVARKEGIRTYILTSTARDTLSIMKVAEHMQLTTENFHWFIPNVFVNPDEFAEIARSGVRLTFLTSPVITPLSRSIMSSYGDNRTAVHPQQLYNDVVKALTKLAIHTVTISCDKSMKSGCLLVDEHRKFACQPHTKDITFIEVLTNNSDVTPIAPIHGHSSAGGSHGRRKRREMPSDALVSSSCKEEQFCRKVAVTYTNGMSRGVKELRKFTVTIDNKYQSKSVASATSTDTRVKREASERIYSTPCSLFEWPSDIKVATTKVIGGLTYKSTVNLCSQIAQYEWKYNNASCSGNLMKGFEIEATNSIVIVEYTEDEKEPMSVGVRDSRNFQHSITYRPFSVKDIKLPHRPLHACAVWHPPWLSWSHHGGKTTFEGFLFDTLNHLSRSMNFTYEMVIHPYFATTIRTTEEEMEKVIYETFENDTCDFFLHTKGIRGGRLGKSELVELSLAYQQPSMFLISKRTEKTEDINIWQFMTPFHEESWVFLWSSFIAVSLFMAYINKKNPYEYQKISASFGPNSNPSDHLGILNSLWFNFASLVQQGVDIVPRSAAAKTLTGAWWIFSLTIITAYTANMTLFMTQINKGVIETLDELASQKEFSYGIMHNNPMLTFFLPDAKERPYTLIYNYLKRQWNDTVFSSHEQAFNKILEGDFYLIASFETTVEALKQSCNFDKLGSGFYKYQFALPFPKGSLLLPLFNDQIARLRDIGILTTLEEQWFSLEKQCENSDNSQTIEGQLDLKAFTGMYVFLIIGCAIGGLFCLLETGWIKWGGIGGFIGKARRYEFKENRRDNRKNTDLIAQEFDAWKGGWEVWKFKEWNNDRNPHSFINNEKKKQVKLEKDILKTTVESSCDICNTCGKLVRRKQEISSFAAYKTNSFTTKKDESKGETTDSGRCSAASESLRESESQIMNDRSSEQDIESNTNLQVPLPLITASSTTNLPPNHHSSISQTPTNTQRSSRTSFLREAYRMQNSDSLQSHSSLASGPLSIANSSTSEPSSERKVVTAHDLTLSDEDGYAQVGAVPPPRAFSGAADYETDNPINSSDDDENEWTDDNSSDVTDDDLYY